MSSLLPRGSELWVIFHDPETQQYVPEIVGKITACSRDGYVIGGRFIAAAYPQFGSEADARAWIAANPRTVPTIKGP